jgi:hypothetical protein
MNGRQLSALPTSDLDDRDAAHSLRAAHALPPLAHNVGIEAETLPVNASVAVREIRSDLIWDVAVITLTERQVFRASRRFCVSGRAHYR